MGNFPTTGCSRARAADADRTGAKHADAAAQAVDVDSAEETPHLLHDGRR